MSDKNMSHNRHHNQIQAGIYLDNHASTPCDPRVIEAMLPYFGENYGNPHSSDHSFGWQASEAVEQARKEVANLIGAKPREIIFTSGATEAINLAIKGVAQFRVKQGRNRLITMVSEHKAVLNSLKQMEQEGLIVTYLPIEKDGQLNLDLLAASMADDVALVTIMAANNEIGTLYPLKEIAAIAHAHGAWFHSDVAQAFGKIPLDVDDMGLDLISISGHKCYAPKGIGALYIRQKSNAKGGVKVQLETQIHGGGQEFGLRSGTVAVPLVVGLGMAAKIAKQDMVDEEQRLTQLKDRLLGHFQTHLQGKYRVNGTMVPRLAGNLHISFLGIESSQLLAACPRLAVSSGSACSSASHSASHVLMALGIDPAIVEAGLRFGLGRFTTKEMVDDAAMMIIDAMKKLTPMS